MLMVARTTGEDKTSKRGPNQELALNNCSTIATLMETIGSILWVGNPSRSSGTQISKEMSGRKNLNRAYYTC